MRILQCIYDSPANPWVGGGGAKRVRHLLSRLHHKGHSIEILCGNFPGARLKSQWNGIHCRLTGVDTPSYALSTLSYALHARQLLWKLSPQFDLIIEDFAPWNPIFSFKNRNKTPAIVQVQNFLGRSISSKFPIIGYPIEMLEARYPAMFKHRVFVNQSLVSAFNVSGEVIPMGVEDEALDLPMTTGNYVGFLGRIDFAQKGIPDLVEALRLSGLPAVFAGRGPDEQKLVELIKDLAHVEWIGPVEGEEKWKFLSQSRVIAMPSRFEGQPLVSLEAAAAGKPIIASDIRELNFISKNNFGIQIDTTNHHQFASNLNKLFSDEEICRDYGISGREFARPRTWNAMGDRFESFCHSIVRDS